VIEFKHLHPKCSSFGSSSVRVPIFQLARQIDGLLAAVQYVFQIKLPLTLINPEFWLAILHNLSLNLPENYEPIAGTKSQSVHKYYNLMKVKMMADTHNIRIVMNVPFKIAVRYFTLYKLVVCQHGFQVINLFIIYMIFLI
jgi:hypothetical protein